MRALRIICLAVAFRLIAAVPLDDENYQNHKSERRNVKREALERVESPVLMLRDPGSTTIVSRDARNSSVDLAVESRASPTRHSKRRRKRRCRNRPACPTPASTTPFKQRAPSRSYDASESNEPYPRLDAKSDREIAAAASTSSSREGAETRQTSVAGVAVTDAENETAELAKKNASNGHANGHSSGARSGTLVGDNEERPVLFDSPKLGEIDIYDENDFEDVDALSWSTTRFSNAETTVYKSDYADVYDAPLSLVSAPVDHQPFYGGLTALLTRLFQTLRNVSAENSRDILKELNFIANTDEDPCQKWLDSWDKFEQAFPGSLVGLPACPCQYPSNIFYNDKIWDERQRKYFRWRDASGDSQRLDVYKPGAAYCVRSLAAQGSKSAASQHCCYDGKRRVLTRGSGAGTPNFVSPEISDVLHEKIDVLPWRLCKGDFSRFNKVRPPNNDNSCETNPDDDEYQRQIDNTKYY